MGTTKGKMKMSIREKLVMIMDMNGWEQDGSGLDFVDVLGVEGRLHFNNDNDLFGFVCKKGFFKG